MRDTFWVADGAAHSVIRQPLAKTTAVAAEPRPHPAFALPFALSFASALAFAAAGDSAAAIDAFALAVFPSKLSFVAIHFPQWRPEVSCDTPKFRAPPPLPRVDCTAVDGIRLVVPVPLFSSDSVPFSGTLQLENLVEARQICGTDSRPDSGTGICPAFLASMLYLKWKWKLWGTRSGPDSGPETVPHFGSSATDFLAWHAPKIHDRRKARATRQKLKD